MSQLGLPGYIFTTALYASFAKSNLYRCLLRDFHRHVVAESCRFGASLCILTWLVELSGVASSTHLGIFVVLFPCWTLVYLSCSAVDVLLLLRFSYLAMDVHPTFEAYNHAIDLVNNSILTIFHFLYLNSLRFEQSLTSQLKYFSIWREILTMLMK